MYLLGPTRPPHAREMAAVLACGPRAVLSHVAAAHLWQLLPHPAPPGPVDVTVAGRNPGQHPGIRVRRTGSLRRSEVTAKHGIRVTTPARTLLDLASQVDALELEHAIAEAFALRLTNRTTLVSTLDRHRGRPGVPVLRGQLEADHPPARTRSHPERHLLMLIRDEGLPHPEANARFGRWQVDLLWREQRVAVEIDGYAAHSSPWAFRRDYAKTADLENGGLRVIRVTWPQNRDQPQATLARITRALEARYQSRP